ncbi:HotDog domain-containing protein [Scheffersomyces amazonensis]|uniref:HotDog domain-containing protein n=1 Tax=Scheffersomyces amazonensis TaxID=1078765 RepID=UPI00315CB8FE
MAEVEDTHTLVNSVIDLKTMADEQGAETTKSTIEIDEYELQIKVNPIYQQYISRYNEFNLKNHLNLHLIKEQLWPNLTGFTLRGQDKINYRSDSLYFIDESYWDYSDIEQIEPHNNNYSITFFHLGSNLSGHNGIVHGGLLATLLDELTCRLAFQNFESKKGVTANLNINYRKPTYVDQYVIIKCIMIKKSGRKCWIKGQVFKLPEASEVRDEFDHESNDNLLTECEVLVIEPKWVHQLQNKETQY